MVGRTVDLESAYRQLVRRKADSPFTVIAVYSPVSNGVEWFCLTALPFGATGSVYGFNRASLALRALCIRLLGLAATSFVDDFIEISWEGLEPHRQGAMLELFELLGWEVSLRKLLDWALSMFV